MNNNIIKESMSKLEKIRKIYSALPDDQRLQAYVRYIYKFGHYDKSMKERNTSADFVETYDINATDLHRFLKTGVGVCQQFAQTLTLLCLLDGKIPCYYTGCKVLVDGEEISHAINIAVINDKAKVFDISSMIHCKEKDFKSDPESFCGVTLNEYMEALENEGESLLSLREGKDKTSYLIAYKTPNVIDFSEEEKKDITESYFEILNKSTDEINKDYSQILMDIWPVKKNTHEF